MSVALRKYNDYRIAFADIGKARLYRIPSRLAASLKAGFLQIGKKASTPSSCKS
jgi:hypothetical protein